ncbi:MAG: cell wall-active antibiotics response protein [Actinobacteria bacterium]|nr:cell wall-active antibiotics response protein [Actinomycetota bacterium]
MKKLFKILLWMIAAEVVMKATALALTRIIGENADEDADDFKLVALMDGRSYESVSTRLRSGRVIVAMGGVDIDLRQALLDPEGARLDLRVLAGGARVLVCRSWRVEVDHRVIGGAAQIEIPDPETLPDGAPILHIDALTVGGGLVIANAESESHAVRS